MKAEESAFPANWKNNDGTIDFVPGLNKRELIAAMAMQGIMARAGNWDGVKDFSFVAKQALIVADELLKQLEK